MLLTKRHYNLQLMTLNWSAVSHRDKNLESPWVMRAKGPSGYVENEAWNGETRGNTSGHQCRPDEKPDEILLGRSGSRSVERLGCQQPALRVANSGAAGKKRRGSCAGHQQTLG